VATGGRRILFLLVVVALLAGIASGAALIWSRRTSAAVDSSVPSLPETRSAQLPARPFETHLGSFSSAEACAFALLGQLDDPRIAKLPALDAETLAALPRARDLLSHQRQLPGGGKPTRIRGGAMAVTPPEGLPAPVADTVGTSGIDVVGASRNLPAAPGPNSARDVSAPVAATGVGRELGQQTSSGGMTLTDRGHAITGEGTWAALRYVPGRDPEPVISDHGQGGYAIALFPEDPGSTRLNGGLIVPGRFYQVTGDMRVTGGAPIDVHVRPLSAVPMYAPVPCLPPAANG
jgi:hypothetical protein